ncbi:unnamed protein product [Caenorhabditis auriculariae]|uniref:Uncharacterized protein n=1 Tax=Caenorhabditis auriculariae TaxID=2777116 RepID=A0A8S1HCA0_9PELO|nr:unnamed protein product [Caenorhabditis auriculariae]
MCRIVALIALLWCIMPKTDAGNVAIVKLVVIEGNWQQPLNSTLNKMVWQVVSTDRYALQGFRVRPTANTSLCELVGNIDRGKEASDFILVVISEMAERLECDPEWGRQNFAILRIIGLFPNRDLFGGVLYVGSSDLAPISKHNVTRMSQVMTIVDRVRFDYPHSRIPDNYPQAAKRQEKKKRQFFLAIIALLVMCVLALLVILFINSLSHFNERKHKGEPKHKKKTNEMVLEDVQKNKSTTKSKSKEETLTLSKSKELVNEPSKDEAMPTAVSSKAKSQKSVVSEKAYGDTSKRMMDKEKEESKKKTEKKENEEKKEKQEKEESSKKNSKRSNKSAEKDKSKEPVMDSTMHSKLEKTDQKSEKEL